MTTFNARVDEYMHDMRSAGRIRSDRTERDYRITLGQHAADVGNRDPRTIGRADVKRTLARWPHPNSQRKNRSILVSFYRWAMEEGIRPDNPAEQTRRPRPVPVRIYRMTRDEARAMLNAARGQRERRVIYLGICAGLRNAELRSLRGEHFQRPGFIRVIGKGDKQAWIPVLADLEPIVAEILATTAPEEYVIPAQRWRNPPLNSTRRDYRLQPCSPQAIWNLVGRVAQRAGISAHIHPHLMRHAFGDHIARHAGLKVAQHLLRHEGVGTTQRYTGTPTLDELTAAVAGFTFGSGGVPFQRWEPQTTRLSSAPSGYPPATGVAIPHEAPTGIEPVQATGRSVEPKVGRLAVLSLASALVRLEVAFRPMVTTA